MPDDGNRTNTDSGESCPHCGRGVGDWHKVDCPECIPGQPITGVSPPPMSHAHQLPPCSDSCVGHALLKMKRDVQDACRTDAFYAENGAGDSVLVVEVADVREALDGRRE